jgi:hypothetical protein
MDGGKLPPLGLTRYRRLALHAPVIVVVPPYPDSMMGVLPRLTHTGPAAEGPTSMKDLFPYPDIGAEHQISDPLQIPKWYVTFSSHVPFPRLTP